MSLRTRFFVLVWLLVFAAMVAMAALLGRWSVVEIQRVSVETQLRMPAPGDSIAAPMDSTRTRRTIERRIARGDVNEGVMRAAPTVSFVRRIVIAILIGSVIAAIATALLARPIVGRVTALAEAVRATRNGALDRRVDVVGDDELADLARSFNAMSADLAASETRRRQLLSDVSHELRTPLTNVIGSIEAIQDGLRSAGPAELAAMHEEAMLLVRLVNDLRDVTLADAGELTLERVPTDAGHAARSAVGAFPNTADVPPIALDHEEGEIMVMADPRRLAQMLRNLLENARTHAAPGSTITLSVLRETDEVLFVVHNDGAPIPAEHLDRIWDRFYRVDASRTRSTGGMGLGLAVVKRLVEAHGGRVGVTSSIATGTTFRVSLPAG